MQWYFQEEKVRQGEDGEGGVGQDLSQGGQGGEESQQQAGSSGATGPVRKRTKKYDIPPSSDMCSLLMV